MAAAQIASAQVSRVYIAPDDHTDYFWTRDDAAYRGAFLRMIDFYLDQKDATAGNPADFQARWNCDGSLWMWEYERARSAPQFARFIDAVRSGHFSVALNPLVVNNGGSPSEAVLRGMYYSGRIERRHGVRFPMAVYMENQTFPGGLPSLWAGSGATCSWKGVCGCDSQVSNLENRAHEIYHAVGPDDHGVLMKWNSLFGSNEALGGYAEARDPAAVVDYMTVNAPFNGFQARWPYAVAGAFGKGWDDFETYTTEFVSVAQQRSNAQRRVIVSNQLDFFADFAARHDTSLLPRTFEAFGNEWDAYAVSLQEQTSRVKRATERLRGAESLAAIASVFDPAFMNGREASRDWAFMALGMFYEHNLGMVSPQTGDTGVQQRIAWQRGLADAAEGYAQSLETAGLLALGELVPSQGPHPRFAAFNPLSWPRTDAVDLPFSPAGVFSVYDVTSGIEVPSQLVTVEGTPRVRILAADLPSVGYRVYEIRPVAGQTFSPAATVTGGSSVVTRTYTIAANNRDALSTASGGGSRVQISGYAAPGDANLYVGNDGDQQTLAMGFAIDLAPGTVVQSARLAVHAGGSASPPSSGGAVLRAYDLNDVPAFVDLQPVDLAVLHPTLPTTVSWNVNPWPIGVTQFSPDLTPLVQQHVNRPGYVAGSYLGLVLTRGTMDAGSYIGIDDSSKVGGVPAALEVAFEQQAGGGAMVIDNGIHRITLDRRGAVTSWVDLSRGGRQWAGTFNGRTLNDLGPSSGGSLVVESMGPVCVTLLATSTQPVAHTTRLTLYRGSDRVDIENVITQNFSSSESWTYAFNMAAPVLRHEELGAVLDARLTTQGGNYATRSARYDLLTLNHFADFSEASAGVTLSSSDSSFMRRGTSTVGTLDTTTPAIAVWAGGKVVNGTFGLPAQGGDARFRQRFAMIPHGVFDQPAAMRASLEHQNPPIAVQLTGTRPSLPPTVFSAITVGNPNVLVWSLKPAEEGISHPANGGLIVRLWNTANVAETATVSVSSALTAIGEARVTTHIETDLSPAPLNNGALEALFATQQMRTFRLLPAEHAPCPADFNADGFLDFFDYDAFVAAFELGGGLEADFNDDGFVDFFDYDAYVQAFEAGC